MIVDTHAFKTAFLNNETCGYVVRTAHPTPEKRHIFAEIFGPPDCYHIFETRAAAEFQAARAATSSPPLDGLSIQDVRVADIRDYQVLAGRKTVFLVNCDGAAAQSWRVGDMPLSARTGTPFPRPLPESPPAVRFQPNPHTHVKFTGVPRAPEASAPAPAIQRVRRRPRLDLG